VSAEARSVWKSCVAIPAGACSLSKSFSLNVSAETLLELTSTVVSIFALASTIELNYRINQPE
jgi:hypothetical protein